ncbi:hypothetical protein GTP46_23005 [Duganella sp. FT135W]|uniref:Uncharacterized protein n=1 Tax=Duganella flavida TaxID=2692175 RepID=A0A6L8KI67_9BURK|nr:hypothetical protein [Duganella flavida]
MSGLIKDVDFAVDERIWGHRLYDEQLPHLTVLEFLCVFGSNLKKPLVDGAADGVTYQPQRQFRLRELLFNNPIVEMVRGQAISDEDKWKRWAEIFKEESFNSRDEDMSYLRHVFSTFEDFARAIELLRSSAFEARSNKRWSSKFVFPFGPDALYEDLRVDAKGGASNDRRFFARTGELLYLMLSRAKNGPLLGQQLAERLFDSSAPMNRLVRAMQGEPQFASQPRMIPHHHLPYSELERFDQLCDDWLAILSLDMPVYDALEHLIAITGLNLLLYFLERAKAQLGDERPAELVCEIVSRERTKVRAISGESYHANQSLSPAAVRAAIEKVQKEPRWVEAEQSDHRSERCAEILHELFQWPPLGGANGKPGKALVDELIVSTLSRHEQHFGKIHSTWSRAIGLSSRRSSRRYRYAPNDALLKSLVVTIVPDRMQFDEFLTEAKRRYGIVIGDFEGNHLVTSKKIDQEALGDNRQNLEARLVGLGLVRRLSDSCSFVENPFGSKEMI